MLTIRRRRGIYKLYLYRSRIFLAFLVVFAVLGAFALKRVWATEEEEPTLTIVSVSQYGEPIDSEYDEFLYNENTGDFGDYYYSVANNTDVVTLGLRIDGIADDETYWLGNGDVALTSQDNGQILYEDVRPYATMEDSVIYDEYGEVDSYSTWANEYHVSMYLRKEDTNRLFGWVDTTLRPRAVGSSNLEIMSVKQDGVDVVLDTVGRQVKDLAVMQTINEYQLLDFTKPVEITCKLKNLHVGWEYSGHIGSENFNFVADSEEISDTVTVNLNAVNKHTELRIYVHAYGPNDEYERIEVPLYFRIVDERFVPLGDVVIEGISQGGSAIDPIVSGNTYTFRANDVEDLTINFRVTSAAEEVTYYVARNTWADVGGASSYPTEWSTVTGAELLEGASITMPARMGESEYSPFSLNMGISMSEDNYNSMHLYYNEYDPESWDGDYIKFEFYEDETIPRYTLAYGYANYPDEEESAYLGMVDARFHDEDNQLKVRIDGTNYVGNQDYEININVKRGDEDYYNETFTATGEQLNNGHTVVMEGLTLRAPEFDADSEDATIWSLSGRSGYNFVIDVNGLKQSALGVFYQYSGWADTMITFAGGSVNATAGRRGMDGAPYVAYGYSNLSSSALDEEKQATLHYLGGGFEDDTEYDCALYFRGTYVDGGLIGDQKLAEGTVTGRDLNSNALEVPLGVPDENSGIMLYDLVIKKDDKLVLIVRDEIEILNEPRIESFKVNNGAEDYSQTGKVNYVVAKDVDLSGTLTGANFDDETIYLLGVEYNINAYDEEEDFWDYVELEDLREELSVTGAELNNGFVHTVNYDERFAQEGVDGVEVYYYFPGYENDYFGHVIYLNYVAPEAAQNTEGGFHIDENGEIQNNEHGEEPSEIPVDIRTPEGIDVIVEGGTLTVVSEKPVTVVGFRNGEWVVLYEWDVVENGEERTNHYSIGDCDEVKVVLKGDGDMNGSISTGDSNYINRSLISPSLPPYRPLSDLERLILDVSGDGNISTADSNLINRSLISSSLPAHLEIQW